MDGQEVPSLGEACTYGYELTLRYLADDCEDLVC